MSIEELGDLISLGLRLRDLSTRVGGGVWEQLASWGGDLNELFRFGFRGWFEVQISGLDHRAQAQVIVKFGAAPRFGLLPFESVLGASRRGSFCIRRRSAPWLSRPRVLHDQAQAIAIRLALRGHLDQLNSALGLRSIAGRRRAALATELQAAEKPN